MGYEIKLMVVQQTSPSFELKKNSDGDLEMDSNGKYTRTGRIEIVCLTIAEIEMCNVGQGKLFNLIRENEKEANRSIKNVYKWYLNETLIETDCYGERKSPVSISEVIEAMKKDNKKEKYRRFDWALSLLKSIQKTMKSKDEFTVIFYGH